MQFNRIRSSHGLTHFPLRKSENEASLEICFAKKTRDTTELTIKVTIEKKILDSLYWCHAQHTNPLSAYKR